MTKSRLFTDGARRGGSVFLGITAVRRAFGLSRKVPGLRRYFIAPFIINLCIMTGLAWLTVSFIYPPVMEWAGGLSRFPDLLRSVAVGLVTFVMILSVFFLYSIIGVIVTAPFNDLISRRVEEHLTGVVNDEPFSIGVLARDIARAVGGAMKLLFLMLLCQAAALLLNLIPGIGSAVYSVVGFTISSFFLGFQFFDFPLERRRMRFRDKLRVVWAFRWPVIGVGAPVILMAFIPVVGFLGLNIASIAAASIFVERVRPCLAEDRR